jgi:signal transduction histidine kinase
VLDPDLTHKLVASLLSNALCYSPSGSTVHLTISYAADEIMLRVTDEGVGIPAADQPHIFEPFYRGANITHLDGLGLGLVIARQVVELHQGTITLQSELGVGTTVTVTLKA